MSSISKEFVDIIKNSEKKGTSPYDTVAEVLRVEGKIAWVRIPGGVDETPAKLSIDAKKGDTVQIRVADGVAFLVGNNSAPPTDDTAAREAAKAASRAIESAEVANASAKEAVADAATARSAAESASESAAQAIEDAATAQGAAEAAQEDATAAGLAAESAQADATAAGLAAEAAQADATAAAEAASVADGKAVAAGQAAQTAQQQATTATNHANAALTQLSVVEDVAGTLDWIQKHGSYTVTADTTVQSGKVYFELVSGEYVPIASPDPTENPHDEGWYELDISDTQSEYIMAHLAVTSAGLWVLPNGKADEYQESTDTEVIAGKLYYERSGSGTAADPYVYTEVVPVGTEDPSEEGWYEVLPDEERTLLGIGYKALLTNTGLEVYDENGILVSNFGENIEFSSTRNQRIGGPNAFIEYDNAGGTLIISGSRVYFSQLDDKVNGLRGDINTELTIVEGDIRTLQERAEIVDNAVIIDPDEPSVTVVSSPSQVKIKSDAIELKGGANATTFITPNGMETTSLTAREMHPRVNVQGQAVGPFSFIARENGHLSLKKMRN